MVNDYLVDWYGTTRERLVGSESNLVGHLRERREGDPFADLLAGERDTVRGEVETEFPGRGAAVVEFRLSPLWVDGTVEGVVGVARDVTEWRERERELERVSGAIDAAPVGITVSDPTREDNPLVYVDDRFLELTGYEASEALGRNCRFLQGPDTDEAPVVALRDAVQAAAPTTVELRNYRKDGSAFLNRVTVAPVEGDDGTATNVVGFQQHVEDV